MNNIKLQLVALISILAITALLTSCTKTQIQADDLANGQNGNINEAPATLPTEEVANVDSSLNQEPIDSEISDLENDLENW